ncbi:MAG: hypothetical protein KDC38_07800 [Planctomycetes bacterium]|nr:hypothetical protein [Planctomycetota bacterium]
MSKPQHFPATATWIHRRLAEGEAGLRAIREHVMAVYFEPLQIYFRGHSGRWKGDADEMVSAFFADRMDRPDFFEKWSKSGLPLHRWLIGGLLLFIKENWKREKRHHRMEALPERFEVAAAAEEIGGDLDRLRIVAIGRELMRRTEEVCREAGLGLHWEVFARHEIDGLPYTDFSEEEFGVSPERAAVLARSPRRRLDGLLREILERDGVDPYHVGAEIETMKELVNR